MKFMKFSDFLVCQNEETEVQVLPTFKVTAAIQSDDTLTIICGEDYQYVFELEGEEISIPSYEAAFELLDALGHESPSETLSNELNIEEDSEEIKMPLDFIIYKLEENDIIITLPEGCCKDETETETETEIETK
jgi:hypothetical protein